MMDSCFVKTGFEESVWVRHAEADYKFSIYMSAHIDDTLILCEDIAALPQFKNTFFTSFEGPDEGEVTEYLGCNIEHDRECCTLTIKQSAYIR